jgi:hypothetical protein
VVILDEGKATDVPHGLGGDIESRAGEIVDEQDEALLATA